NAYTTPSNHLFEQMQIALSPEEGAYRFGKGTVYVLRNDPKEYVLTENGDKKLIETVENLYEQNADAGKLEYKNNFYLSRGAYDLVSVLEESVSDTPYLIEGELVDLFDPTLPVYRSRQIQPGEQAFFLNIDRIEDKNKPQVLASAGRSYNEIRNSNSYSFISKGPADTYNATRVLLPVKPEKVMINSTEQNVADLWDTNSNTCLLRFDNSPEGVKVEFSW
ncbi:MAG: hypothetical protein RR346_11440, partial [Bacteroidales bacterium]